MRKCIFFNIRFLLATLTLLFCVESKSQNSDLSDQYRKTNLEGIWKIQAIDKNDQQIIQELFGKDSEVIFRNEKSWIAVISNVSNRKEIPLLFHEGDVSFESALNDSGSVKVTFINNSDQNLTGTIQIPSGRIVKFEAVRRKYFFSCSNHSPAHIAQSLNDAKEMTNKFGCLDWHRN